MDVYDPNEARDFSTNHRIRFTFQQWEYKTDFIKEVGGNRRGLSNLSCAVDSLLEQLPTDDHGNVYMELANDAGETVRIDASSNAGLLNKDAMMGMLVKAEIIELVPDSSPGRTR